MNLRALKTEFARDGFTHRLVTRQNSFAIYERSKNGVEHFEVIRVRTNKPHPKDRNLDGVELVEEYPGSESWGKYGFTHQTLKEAQTKAARIAIAASTYAHAGAIGA